MKRVIIGLLATSLLVTAAVYGYNKTNQKEGCKEGSACCYPDGSCCKK